MVVNFIKLFYLDKDAEHEATITIKGDSHDANSAKNDILNLTSSNFKRGRDQSESSRNYEARPSAGFKESLEIYQDKVGMVIGRGGATIKDIQSKFNVRVNVNKDVNYNGKCSVSVSGNSGDVEKAIENIRELVGEPSSNGSQQFTGASSSNQQEPEPMDFEPIDWQAAARESVSTYLFWIIFIFNKG